MARANLTLLPFLLPNWIERADIERYSMHSRDGKFGISRDVTTLLQTFQDRCLKPLGHPSLADAREQMRTSPRDCRPFASKYWLEAVESETASSEVADLVQRAADVSFWRKADLEDRG